MHLSEIRFDCTIKILQLVVQCFNARQTKLLFIHIKMIKSLLIAIEWPVLYVSASPYTFYTYEAPL